MPKPIFTSNPGRSADSSLCCWPTCNTPSLDFPLCWKHAVKAYTEVKSSLDGLLDHAAALPMPLDQRTGNVYFIRFRDRIKIGFSISPLSRIGQQPHDEILAIISGTMADEKRLHAAFAHLRENGEWFRPEPDLIDYITDVAASHAKAS